MHVCKCGVVVAQARVDVLLKAGKSLSQIRCIKCASANPEPRKLGFPIRDHKMQGSLLISDDQDLISSLYDMSSRTGGIQVSKGVRFKK